jgi:hypothetical protein
VSDELPEHAREFVAGLSKDDVQILQSLVTCWRTVQGWCRVNRWIALTAIGILIALAQGLDEIKGLLGLKQ